MAAMVVVYVVTSDSRHPKNPGEMQVVEVTVLTRVVEEEEDVVVVLSSSRQPHHPGVLQMDVLVVRVKEDVVDDVRAVVVPPEELLLMYFQLKQFASGQSTTGSHVATLSYASRTLGIT